jgi:hypothetical protein
LSGSNRVSTDADADEDRALAVAFRYLKGSHAKDLVGTARALANLKKLPRYRSTRALGEAVGVSGEIVREFLSLLNLPGPVLEMFDARRLNSLEQGRRLAQLQRHRNEIVMEAAELMVGMTAHDARAMVDYLIRHPDAGPQAAAEAIEKSKSTKRREYHVVALVDEGSYHQLVAHSKKREQPIDELVTEIVLEWTQEHAR